MRNAVLGCGIFCTILFSNQMHAEDIAHISHIISSKDVQDGASDLFSTGRKHCPSDKESPGEDKDDVADCADLPRESEKCGLAIFGKIKPCNTQCKSECEPDECQPKKCECFQFAAPDTVLCNAPSAYNIPAQIEPGCSWGPFLYASFLYWNVSQDYMELGRTALFTDPLPATNATPVADATIPTPNFEYQAGFNIGLGYSTDFDDWVVEAKYTYLHHKNNFSTGTNLSVYTASDVIIIPNEWWVNLSVDTQQQAGSMTSKWKMNFDMLDGLLSRPFYQGTRLTVTPFVGLKGLWIKQKYNISAILANHTSAAPVESKNKSKAWGIGPNLAANLHWLIGKGARVEFNAALSLLYMRFTQREHTEIFSNALTSTLPINGHMPVQGSIKPMNELGLGLGWGSYINQRYHIDFSARYDFMILWGQNAMRETVGYLANNAVGYSNPQGNLYFHGLTATARFDF